MIRAATHNDAPSIAALWNWMIRDTLATFTPDEKTLREIKDLITARQNAFFVARSEDTLSGFITFGPFRNGPGYAATVELSVIVAPALQGTGVGRSLMFRAEQAAAEMGHHVMVAAISGANDEAVAFHQALGFTETGRMAEVGRKGGQWLDLILMQKFLS